MLIEDLLKYRILNLIVILSSVLGIGCASVSMVSKDKDLNEKQFQTSSVLSKVYPSRDEESGKAKKIRLSLFGTSVGQNAFYPFHSLEVTPVKHGISCRGEESDSMRVRATANKPLFVWHEMVMSAVKSSCEVY